ncbi:MAG TPA: ATP-grasp domain-containing protein [Dongiaceae bacterium]|nr:ATP-grasp domain-containing protein [Dongiaceae bacterium]
MTRSKLPLPACPNLLVIATNDKLALNVLRCAHVAGMTTHLLGGAHLTASRYSRHCASWTPASLDFFQPPYDRAVAAINRCCAEKIVHVVVGVDLPAILLLATIREQLTGAHVFPLAPPELIRRWHNKWTFAQFLKEQGLPHPRTFLVESPDQLEQLPLEYPLVVKPLDREGGWGVRQLNSQAEARAHLQQNSPAARLPLLFQEFVPGEDIGLSVLAHRGELVQWTVQRALPHGGLEFLESAGIRELGEKMVRAAGYHGVANFDLQRNARDGTVKVLECNPRFWASLPASMWNGVNFVAAGVNLLTATELRRQPQPRQIIYTTPFQVLTQLLRGDLTAPGRLSRESLREAWMLASDPVTLACIIKRKLFPKSSV